MNDKRLQMVRANRPLLKKINYPAMKFTGLQQQDSTIFMKAMCYYVLSQGADYAVPPTSVVFMLNAELEPISYGIIYVSEFEQSYNTEKAYYFDGKVFETTTFRVVNTKLLFEPNLYQSFSFSEGDTLTKSSNLKVDKPRLINAPPLYYNHISASKQHKLVWFNYFPELFDVNKNKWVQLDSSIFGVDLANDFSEISTLDSLKFEILAMQPTKKSIVAVFRVRNQVFFAQQYGEKIHQCIPLYTIPKGGRASFFFNDSRSIYAICQDNEGNSKLMSFKLDLDVYFE